MTKREQRQYCLKSNIFNPHRKESTLKLQMEGNRSWWFCAALNRVLIEAQKEPFLS